MNVRPAFEKPSADCTRNTELSPTWPFLVRFIVQKRSYRPSRSTGWHLNLAHQILRLSASSGGTRAKASLLTFWPPSTTSWFVSISNERVPSVPGHRCEQSMGFRCLFRKVRPWPLWANLVRAKPHWHWQLLA